MAMADRWELDRFIGVWVSLTEDGICDEIGGMEYQRILSAWIDARYPTPIASFIAEHAHN